MNNAVYKINAGVLLALMFSIFSPSYALAKDDDWFYRRPSICSFVILHPEYKFGEEIEAIFNNLPVPERFNDHGLGVRSIKFAESDRNDQTSNISNFIKKTGLGQKLVSKWFGRNKSTGAFNTDLIRSRGLYDANAYDIDVANRSALGKAMLEDAGEELIPNTYVIFNDVMYKSKSGVGSLLKVVGSMYTGNLDGVNDGMQEIGGFRVTIKSYLYRLKWNEETAAGFYNDFFFDESAPDAEKKISYEKHPELYGLEFVGVSTSTASETSFAGVKDASEALRKICVRVIDKNIADLQKSFPEFRIKAPLMSADPLMADVGLKEGVTKDSKFEVLMPEMKDGKLKYNRIGVISPVEDSIKDNRYMAEEENAANSGLKGTVFRQVSGGELNPGMLIREIE